MLGLALHPRLLQGAREDYVYVAFTYQEDSGPRLKVQRFSYDPSTRTLGSPVDLIAGLPAHDDHVAGRLAIGPDEKLYLTIGDQGSNWLQNYCNLNRAQDLPTAADVQARSWTSYEGKVLRLNFEVRFRQTILRLAVFAVIFFRTGTATRRGWRSVSTGCSTRQSTARAPTTN